MINKNNFPILVINVSYVSCNGAVEAGLIYLRIVTPEELERHRQDKALWTEGNLSFSNPLQGIGGQKIRYTSKGYFKPFKK